MWRETSRATGITEQTINFNPLPPCGGRPPRCNTTHRGKVFQSTPSVWRETIRSAWASQRRRDFNPLPPCGGRREEIIDMFDNKNFNPLPPCGGRRFYGLQHSLTPLHFNPLPPCGGRQGLSAVEKRFYEFQSTPSVWRETLWSATLIDSTAFQSTPSVWRETGIVRRGETILRISIHSLRVEGDFMVCNTH